MFNYLMRYFKAIVFLFCTGGLLFCLNLSDAKAIDYSSLKFEHLRTNNGLSNSSVNAITVDGNGFLWFATNDGLNKYDGHSFTIYRNLPNDSTSLSSNRINALVTDKNGRVWIGTSAGLNLYDHQKNRFFRFQHDESNKHSLQNNAITYLFYDSLHNYLWISADPEGLCKLDLSKHDLNNIQFSRYSPETIEGITSFIIDNQDRLFFFGRENKIFLYSPESDSFQTYPLLKETDENLQHKSKVAIKDINNHWWILCNGKAYIFEDASTPERFGIKFNRVVDIWSEALITDNENNIWCGIESLNIIDPHTFRVKYSFSPSQDAFSISNSEIKCMYLDTHDILWIGTANNGINKCQLKNSFFNYYQQKTEESKGLSGKVVSSIMGDRDKNIWFSLYDGGITVFNKTTHNYTHLNVKSGDLSTDKIVDLFEDENGKIWAGTWTGGLNMIKKDDDDSYQCTEVNFDVSDKFGLDCIWRITEDQNKNLWLATQEVGLVRFNKETSQCQKFPHHSENQNSIRGNMVISMLIDSKNRLFAGTYLGLDVINLNDFEKTGKAIFYHFPEYKSVNGCRINHIYEDRKGNLWISTDGNGLLVLSPNLDSIKSFTKEEGLPANIVTAVTEDQSGAIWISTQGGIAKYNPETSNFFKYDENNGLFLKEFKRGSIHTSSSGELFMGTVNGAVSFNPAKQLKIKSPTVYLNNIIIDNQQVNVGEYINGRVLLESVLSETQGITLFNNENTFTLSFASIDFINPANNYYYKMEGLDSTWNYLNNDNNVTFQDVKPGTYLFKIRSGINSIKNDTPETVLKISIKQSFFKSPFFYTIIVLMIGVLIWYFYHFFKRKFERLKDTLQSITNSKGKYATSKLTNSMISDIQTKLNQYMLEAKPYLKHDLKQTDIAKELDIPSHELSQVLNQNLHTTFRDYLNKFRVEEFIRKMENADLNKFTIMAIAEQCGFQSKSSFYRSFNKVTGQTPAEYFHQSH